MLYVRSACPCLCCMSMLHVHVYAACPCCISMLHVHASCLCYMSMLHFHTAFPCNMLMLHGLAAWPCCTMREGSSQHSTWQIRHGRKILPMFHPAQASSRCDGVHANALPSPTEPLHGWPPGERSLSGTWTTSTSLARMWLTLYSWSLRRLWIGPCLRCRR
jgi:hypothetical protein